MEGESDMSLPSTTAPVPGSDEQMPKLEELQAICNLSTEEINVKIEPLDPEYLDNDSVSYEEEEACPESIVIKAEPFLFDNEEGECGTSVKAETPKKRKIKKEENSDDEEDEDYIPQKKLIAKPKAEPGTYRNRSQRKKRPTTKNLHSYNALTNIEVVSISEVERREEHKANLMKKCNYVYRCDDCALGFISKRAFEKHMESHTERPGFLECDICHTYLKSDEMLYQHKLRHYRRYRCLLCTDVTYYKDRETVACHIKTVHEEDRFLCEYCEKSFKRPAYLHEHMKIHQKAEQSNTTNKDQKQGDSTKKSKKRNSGQSKKYEKLKSELIDKTEKQDGDLKHKDEKHIVDSRKKTKKRKSNQSNDETQKRDQGIKEGENKSDQSEKVGKHKSDSTNEDEKHKGDLRKNTKKRKSNKSKDETQKRDQAKGASGHKRDQGDIAGKQQSDLTNEDEKQNSDQAKRSEKAGNQKSDSTDYDEKQKSDFINEGKQNSDENVVIVEIKVEKDKP